MSSSSFINMFCFWFVLDLCKWVTQVTSPASSKSFHLFFIGHDLVLFISPFSPFYSLNKHMGSNSIKTFNNEWNKKKADLNNS